MPALTYAPSPPPVHREQLSPWRGWYAGLSGWLVATAGESAADCLRTLILAGVALGRCRVLPRGVTPWQGGWQITDIKRDHEGYALPLYTAWVSSWEEDGVWLSLGSRHGEQAAWDLLAGVKIGDWWKRRLVMAAGRHPREVTTC